ncbi:hypothetical protein X566_05910 [Afipia sp. P52-10]|nr:hypothetical protein X566_05910 [Afipia sp. P52-10]
MDPSGSGAVVMVSHVAMRTAVSGQNRTGIMCFESFRASHATGGGTSGSGAIIHAAGVLGGQYKIESRDGRL